MVLFHCLSSDRLDALATSVPILLAILPATSYIFRDNVVYEDLIYGL